jgi:hypothetical protein
MKTYRVVWSETFTCSKVVEAESEEEAQELCYDIDEPDTREFESYHDWSVVEEDELNPEEEEG